MGYFASGAEGMDYEARWCADCAHYGRCAVLSAHEAYNYTQCETRLADLREALSLFIPRGEDGRNGACTMRILRTEVET